VVCTHAIQAGGVPVLKRLGITDAMERAGAVRSGLAMYTPAGGWFVLPDDEHGYNLRREKLDPMVRELAARTPGVEVRSGVTVTGVLREGGGPDGRVAGLRGRTPDGTEVEVRATVTVGADGRGSDVARLAHVPGRVLPHGRFGYMAYYSGLEEQLRFGAARNMLWLLGRDVYYMFPNDDGLTIAAQFLHKNRLEDWRGDGDKEASFLAGFDGLDSAPDVRGATRVSPLIGKLDMPNVRRRAAQPGLAFVGDAAQASDPLWGVGCGFALMSAAWLADEVAGAITAGVDPAPALERYRRTHRRMLAGHHYQMADFATGRDFTPFEKLMYKVAARDEQTTALVARAAARDVPAQQVFPRIAARAARVVLTGGAR
jgi:2-polyprenyl-6-methoxyphenol hydroxylase-like FAD-dependent oxidoreductase